MIAPELVAAELERRRPGYLPGWPTDAAGRAFLAVLSELLALVDEGLDQAPTVSFLAFLDAMGVNLLPPSPARAPLVFTLAPDAPVDVAVPQDSEVAAVLPPPLPASFAGAAGDTPDPIVFATDRGISAARARLAAVTSILPSTDELAHHEAAGADGLELFTGTVRVPHHLYLGHDRLFDLPGSAEIALQVGIPQRAPGSSTAAVTLAWEYLTDAGWMPFSPVSDHTYGMTIDGEVVLRKLCSNALARGIVDGVESFWIRARTVDALPAPGGDDRPLPRVDMLRASVAIGRTGLFPQVAYADATPLDTTKDFLPFGAQPGVGAAFYLACDDAFKREGARISLTIEPSVSSTADGTGVSLTWEYSTGEGSWFAFSPADDELFQKKQSTNEEPRTVSFVRPSKPPNDWRKATVNGESHFWLRVRVSAGSYGSPPTFANNALQGGWTPPILARLTISYMYETPSQSLDHCITLNRFDYDDRTEAAHTGRAPFQPFRPVPDREPAVYLGFDGALPVGLMSVLVASVATAEAGTAPEASPFTWEYRSPVGWSELSVLDESGGFRRTGLVEFVGPADHVPDSGPTGSLYWLRARLKAATATPPALPLAGVYANAVWATNRTSVRREIVGRSDGTPRLVLPLQHGAVLPDEVVEVQEWHGTGREWESLFRGVPGDDLRFDTDGRGLVTGVWVRWRERTHLYSSGPRDRDYTVERIEGVLRFGDGDSGMVPPPGSPVAASYVYGGGMAGNVRPHAVTQLLSALPYVESVTNPLAASGGAAAERADNSRGVQLRGPMQLRHRERGVRAADLAWLARDASSEVALARCLPTTGPDGAGMPGWVTIVVAPWSEEPEPQPSAELLARVREYLARRAPAATATQVRVVGPTYLPISVATDVVVGDGSGAAAVEDALRRRIATHLHALLGGPEERGWQFGEAVRLSRIAEVVETTPGVDYAAELQLTAGGAAYGDSVPVPADSLPSSGRHLLKLRVSA